MLENWSLWEVFNVELDLKMQRGEIAVKAEDIRGSSEFIL